MKILNVVQGTDEWRRARAGLPTASNFHLIVTPSGKSSSSATKYMGRLLAEWFLGEPMPDQRTGYMERGTALEPDARRWYEWERDVDVQEVGLCLTDDGLAGASPDGLVGDDGGVELKCPGIDVHMGYLLGGLVTDHYVQVQGLLWVTGRKWWDLCSWNPALPKVRTHIERAEDFIAILADEVSDFCRRMEEFKKKYGPDKARYDAERPSRREKPIDDDPFATRATPPPSFDAPPVGAR